MSDQKNLTTSVGAPVPDNENVLTAGPRGPMPVSYTHLVTHHAMYLRTLEFLLRPMVLDESSTRTTVSYTHLDVYKRQMQSRAGTLSSILGAR